eukprot:TRINITY_DN6172_c0_g1_i1.p2 TRINITY_DN6172_c0_g1~~TRINITY_DN6172_c0_g1_i1.p2  ORF type:complete len:224 (-),score=13.01 TRINITY_DN6172_c0_g1_i1:226-843(-)
MLSVKTQKANRVPNRPQLFQKARLPRVHAASEGATPLPKQQEHEATHNDAKEGEKVKPLQRVTRWIFGGPVDKEKLKSLGLGAFVAYGFVSNVTYGACFTIGWASHVAATGTIPFAQGQWPGFMARLAGLLVLQQFLRPLRFSGAMLLTPFVDRIMAAVQNRFKISKRNAFAVMCLLLALGTLAGFGVALTAVTVWNMPPPNSAA